MSDQTKTPVKRRDFLKVVGASTAVAAVGCSEHTGKLIPYVSSPDQTVPGVSTYFATTCRECSAACGVLAETRDGRVIKLEGNPDHPLNRGALCARGQAAAASLTGWPQAPGPASGASSWPPAGHSSAVEPLHGVAMTGPQALSSPSGGHSQQAELLPAYVLPPPPDARQSAARRPVTLSQASRIASFTSSQALSSWRASQSDRSVGSASAHDRPRYSGRLAISQP